MFACLWLMRSVVSATDYLIRYRQTSKYLTTYFLSCIVCSKVLYVVGILDQNCCQTAIFVDSFPCLPCLHWSFCLASKLWCAPGELLVQCCLCRVFCSSSRCRRRGAAPRRPEFCAFMGAVLGSYGLLELGAAGCSLGLTALSLQCLHEPHEAQLVLIEDELEIQFQSVPLSQEVVPTRTPTLSSWRINLGCVVLQIRPRLAFPATNRHLHIFT